MKNKMKILVAAICVASGIAYFMADEMIGNKVVSDLALENINALASGEGSTNITCAQPGCIDCFVRGAVLHCSVQCRGVLLRHPHQ